MKKRTTLTLDPDVVARLEDEVHRQRKPYRQVVNEAIRRGLSGSARTGKLPLYRLKPFKGGLMPGFEKANFNHVASQLEDEAIVSKLRRGR